MISVVNACWSEPSSRLVASTSWSDSATAPVKNRFLLIDELDVAQVEDDDGGDDDDEEPT